MALLILVFLSPPVQSQQTERTSIQTHNLQFQDPSLLLMQCTYHLWRLSNQTRTLAAFDNILTSNYNYGLWTLGSVDTVTTTPPVISFHEKCSVNIIIHRDQLNPEVNKLYSILVESEYTWRTKNHNMFIFVFIQAGDLPFRALQFDTKIYIHTLLEPSTRFPQYYFCPWCWTFFNPLPQDLSITSMDYDFIKGMKRYGEGLRKIRLYMDLVYSSKKSGARRYCPWLRYPERPTPGYCNNIEAIYDALSITFNFTLKGLDETTEFSDYGHLFLAVWYRPATPLTMTNNMLYFDILTRKVLYWRSKITKQLVLLSFDVWASPFGYEIYITLFLLSLILIILAQLTVLDCLALVIAQGIRVPRGKNWLVIIVSLLLTTIIASTYQSLITSKLIVPPEYKPVSNLSEFVRNGGKVVVSYLLDKSKENYMSLAKHDFIKYGIEEFFPQSVVLYSAESNGSQAQYDLIRSQTSTVFGIFWINTDVQTARYSAELAFETKSVVEEVTQPLGYDRGISEVFSWNGKSILRRIAEYREYGFYNFWTEINLYFIEIYNVRRSRNGINLKEKELEEKGRNVLNLLDLVSVYSVFVIMIAISFFIFLLERNVPVFVYIFRRLWDKIVSCIHKSLSVFEYIKTRLGLWIMSCYG